MQLAKSALLLFMALMYLPAQAQETLEEREAAEELRRQAFLEGMIEIVADMNEDSFDELVDAIDEDDMLERIFGLRLIDQRIKRDFREDLDKEGRFAAFINSQYSAEAKDGVKAHLLVVESRGDRGRAVVRFDLARFQVNYIEYELELDHKNRMYVRDWTDYLWGHSMTGRMGLTLVQAQPSKNAVRKLVDFRNVRDQHVFQVMEALKAARDFNLDRFFQIYDDLEPVLKGQRVVLKVGLDATRVARKRRSQRILLVALAEHFPDDPLYSLSLLDYYFPDKQYDKALDALLRLQGELNIDEPVMNSRLSSATLVLGQVEDAVAYADRAVQQDPTMELAWWAVFRANVAAENFGIAVDALETLEANYGHSFGPDALSKDPSMSSFLASSEYKTWFESEG